MRHEDESQTWEVSIICQLKLLVKILSRIQDTKPNYQNSSEDRHKVNINIELHTLHHHCSCVATRFFVTLADDPVEFEPPEQNNCRTVL